MIINRSVYSGQITSCSSIFVRPVLLDLTYVDDLVRRADYQLTIVPTHVWPLGQDQFPINPTDVANLPNDRLLLQNQLNIPLQLCEHQCIDHRLHNFDRSLDWMAGVRIFAIFVILSNTKLLPSICTMEVVFRDLIDVSLLPEPTYDEQLYFNVSEIQCNKTNSLLILGIGW